MTPRAIVHSASTLLTLAALASVVLRHAVDRGKADIPKSPSPVTAAAREIPGVTGTADRRAKIQQGLRVVLRIPYPLDRSRSLLTLIASLPPQDFPMLLEEIDAEGYDANRPSHDMALTAWLEADGSAALTWLQEHGYSVDDLRNPPSATTLDWAVDACNRQSSPPLNLLAGALTGMAATDPSKASAALERLDPAMRGRLLEPIGYGFSRLSYAAKRSWIDSARNPGARTVLLTLAFSDRDMLRASVEDFEGNVEKRDASFYRNYGTGLDSGTLRTIASHWAEEENALDDVGQLAPESPLLDAAVVERGRYLLEKREIDKAVDVLSRYPGSIADDAAAYLARSALTGNPEPVLEKISAMPDSSLRDLLLAQTLSTWRSVAGPARPDHWLAAHPEKTGG